MKCKPNSSSRTPSAHQKCLSSLALKTSAKNVCLLKVKTAQATYHHQSLPRRSNNTMPLPRLYCPSCKPTVRLTSSILRPISTRLSSSSTHSLTQPSFTSAALETVTLTLLENQLTQHSSEMKVSSPSMSKNSLDKSATAELLLETEFYIQKLLERNSPWTSTFNF